MKPVLKNCVKFFIALSTSLTVLVAGNAVDAFAGVKGCNESLEGRGRFSYETLPSLPLIDGTELGRTAIQYDDGTRYVVQHLEHKPKSWERKGQIAEVRLFGGTIVNEKDSEALENHHSVNCFAYACLVNEVPGLINGWIEAAPHEVLENINPLGTILNAYFYEVAMYMRPDFEKEEAFQNLREGDLVLFRDAMANPIHAGVIRFKPIKRAGQEPWIRSKFGINITADLRPKSMNYFYPYRSVVIYRKKIDRLR